MFGRQGHFFDKKNVMRYGIRSLRGTKFQVSIGPLHKFCMSLGELIGLVYKVKFFIIYVTLHWRSSVIGSRAG